MEDKCRNKIQEMSLCIKTSQETRREIHSLIQQIHKHVEKSNDICTRGHELLKKMQSFLPHPSDLEIQDERYSIDKINLAAIEVNDLQVGSVMNTGENKSLSIAEAVTTVEESEAVGGILEMDFPAEALDEPTPADFKVNETYYNDDDNSEDWISEQSSEYGESTATKFDESVENMVEPTEASSLVDVEEMPSSEGDVDMKKLAQMDYNYYVCNQVPRKCHSNGANVVDVKAIKTSFVDRSTPEIRERNKQLAEKRESGLEILDWKKCSWVDGLDEQTPKESPSLYVGSSVERDSHDSFRELFENGCLDDKKCKKFEPFIEDSTNINFKYEIQDYLEQSSKEIKHSEASVVLMNTLDRSSQNDFDLKNWGAAIESLENIESVEEIIEQEALLYDKQTQEGNINSMCLFEINEISVDRKTLDATLKPIDILERNVGDVLNLANIVPNIHDPSQSVMLGGVGGDGASGLIRNRAADVQINERIDVFEESVALNGIRELMENGYLDDIQGIPNLEHIVTNYNIEDYRQNQDSDETVIIDVKPKCIDRNQQDESALEGSESTDATIELVELLLHNIDFVRSFESSDTVDGPAAIDIINQEESKEGFESFTKNCQEKYLTFDDNIESSNKEFGREENQKRLELPEEEVCIAAQDNLTANEVCESLNNDNV